MVCFNLDIVSVLYERSVHIAMALSHQKVSRWQPERGLSGTTAYYVHKCVVAATNTSMTNTY